MSEDDGSREEVPMTAVLTGDVTMRMPQGREWTWADLQGLPERAGHRYEIIDGSLHVSASPTPWHQLVTSRIGSGLRAVAPDRLLMLEGVDIEFEDSVLEPDILVVHEAA